MGLIIHRTSCKRYNRITWRHDNFISNNNKISVAKEQLNPIGNDQHQIETTSIMYSDKFMIEITDTEINIPYLPDPKIFLKTDNNL